MVHLSFVRKQLSNCIQIILGTICVVYLLSILGYYISGPKTTSVWDRKIADVDPPTRMPISKMNLALLNTTSIQNIVVRAPPKKELRGSLNLHLWYSICGNTVDSLRRHVLFPKHPKFRTSITQLHTRLTKLPDFGQRIFGYVHPPLNGSYQFSVSSDDFSEVWLSPDESLNNTNLICQVTGFTKDGDFHKYKQQTSQKISLDGGKKYFFEVLHKQGESEGHMHVTWKLPGWTNFATITSEFISLFMEEKLDISLYKRDDREPLPEMILEYHVRTKNLRPSLYRNYTRLPAGSDIELLRHSRKSLPTCKSFVFLEKLKRYDGKMFTHIPSLFPQDGSSNVLTKCSVPKGEKLTYCKGNPVLKKEIAYAVAEKYLNVSFPGRFILKSVIRLERILEKPTNDYRYFIEIEVIDKNSRERARIADHVVESHVNGKLCYPTETTWSPDVIVYVIITIKNQGNWLRHTVDNLVEIQEQTNDENIHPIIVDFGSRDVDMDIYLKRSGLKNYTVIHKKGKFFKTAAINEAAGSVKDNNSIIFLLDLHLDLPIYLFQTLRKHTIQGDIAFVPILTRLACGSAPDSPTGHWEVHGYGLFAIYKSDWIRFGGMNEKEFSNRWGGEDWEMMDRVIKANIQVQKLKMPGLFHFFHNRGGMWEKAA